MPRLRWPRITSAAVWLALVAAVIGCHQGTRDPPKTESAAKGPYPAVQTSIDEVQKAEFPPPPDDDLDGGTLVEEIWDTFSMQGTRVGYARTTLANVVENGQPLIRTSNFTLTVMKRAGQTIEQEMTLTSWDTPDGRLVRFESRISSGPGEVVATGAVRDNQLGIDITTLGRTQSQKIPWQAEWGGIFAPDQSLRRQPMKPGEKRTVRSLLPIFNMAGDTHLDAIDFESIDLPSGKAKVLKIKSTIEVAGQKIETLVWANEKGESLKSVIPSIGQEAVRTTKQDALRQSASGQYDLLVASTVPLKGTLPDPQQTKRVVYRARMKSGSIKGLFSDSPLQQVKVIDDQTAEITVLAIRPSSDLRSPTSAPPTPADSTPNNFIQSDDREIAQMAARVMPNESDTWKLAGALEQFVDETILEKNFSQAFATAAEVARSLEGDCTEHAVLLAALCRARKIPARVAFGLVYYPPEKGFAYHMWNEVWIKDRWVPLDPTLGMGGIGADHIKLGDSNLSGGSPLADLLSVIQVFGRLELEVLSAE
jgi:hypothetical protein